MERSHDEPFLRILSKPPNVIYSKAFVPVESNPFIYNCEQKKLLTYIENISRAVTGLERPRKPNKPLLIHRFTELDRT